MLTIDQVKVVDKIDFHYQQYKDDVLIIGGKGKRKTTRAQKILELPTMRNIPYWIWDYSNRFNGYGQLVHKVEDLQYGQYVIQDWNSKSKENYGKFLNKAFYEVGKVYRNLVVVTDELHQITKKNEIFQPLYEFVLSGRNWGLSSIFITTRPQSVPNYILSNLQHIFAFSLHLKSDIDWLKDYIGDEAWLLIPKDKRRDEFFKSEKDPNVLPVGSFIYRNLDEPQAFVVIKNDV